MRILFAALHPGYYRNLDSLVDTLAERGHHLYLGSERADARLGGEGLVESLAARYTNVTHGAVPTREPQLAFLASKVRFGLDYLRYLEPVYNGSSGLRPRAEVRTPVGMVQLSRTLLGSTRRGRRLLTGTLDAIDRALPPSPSLERFLDDQRPDVLAITPLIGLVASSQLDLLRSARARGIPTAVFVWSWDHLSSKAIIRDQPDALFVWNDAQRREATDMHRVPASRVIVTGAQCYDKWFGRAPAMSRTEFVRHAGLPDDTPFALWVCSALLPGSPPEPDVVLRWVEHLRQSPDPRLRSTPILIRPHPSRLADWDNIDWRRFGRIAMCGRSPVDPDSRSEYFDSLYHSAAVVGVTTSAFLEAAIVGRPVMTIFSDDLRQEHEGSLHFQHLLTVGGGVMIVARSLAEHATQLASVLDGLPRELEARRVQFVHEFVRPHGLTEPATRVAADALERVTPVAPSAWRPSISGRAGLRAIEAMERHPRLRLFLRDEREGRAEMRQQAKERQRQQALAAKAQKRAEKERARAR